MKPMRREMIFVLVTGLAAVCVSGAGVPAGAQTSQTYAVATLAPIDVTVPPILLDEPDLHAMLVELATGTDRATIGERLGLDAAEVERLFALAEVEALGRQTAEGWIPLALALDAEGVGRLTTVADSMATAIADTVEARWTWLDSMVAALPVAGQLPLAQTGHALLGGYLLGLYQADSLWRAGLAPSDRTYAFRVYGVPLDEAPSGHIVQSLGEGGWVLDRFAPDRSIFGLARLGESSDPLIDGLLGEEEMVVEERELPGQRERFRENVLAAYRAWYLLERQPESTTRLLLERLEAVDTEGRLRVPLVSERDRRGLRSIAASLADATWPILGGALPEIGVLAEELGYGDPRLLGEVALWTWERAAQMAVELLVERDLLAPPIAGRSQALLMPPVRP